MNNNGNLLNNNSNMNQMSDNKDKIINIKFADFQNKSVSEILGKELFIIKKENNTNNILNNQLSLLNNKTLKIIEKSLKIISSAEEVQKLINDNSEFFLVNKEYLENMKSNQEEYIGKEVIFFESNNKKYLIFPKDNAKILEIDNSKTPNNLQDNNPNKVLQSNMNIEKINETKDIILKKLILLHAFEKHFMKLINSPIKDEYDINEYYLINKNWINYYKSTFLYQQIIQLIDSMQLTISYKGYCTNIDEIFNQLIMNNNNNKIFLNYFNNIENSYNNNSVKFCKEDNFIPSIFGETIVYNQKIKYPNEFLLIPENLFDLFYKGIASFKYSKEDYKCNALLGDKVLFIQSKQNINIFYTYLLPEKKDSFTLSSIFFYSGKYFYNEIKEYIKGKGFINYINKRNLFYNASITFNPITVVNNNILGVYKFYQTIDQNLIKEVTIKESLDKCANIYKFYKNFISKLFSLKDNKIQLTDNINMSNINYIPTFIVMKDLFNLFKDLLLFKDIEFLSKIKGREQYDINEKKIINTLLGKNFDFNSVSYNIKGNFFLSNHFNCNFNLNQFSFSFVCKELLLKINNDQDYCAFLQNQEEFCFFINNNEYFIYSPLYQKVYKVIFQDADKIEFKLKEFEFNKEFINVIQIFNELYNSETHIKSYRKINLSMKGYLKNDIFYLINRKWMENYKKYYNYDLFVSNRSMDKKVLLSMFKKQDIPDYLKNSHYLSPNYDNSNSNAPINFELVKKDIFDSIIKDLNTKNNINLKMSQCYNVMLGDKKIFVKENSNQNLYFIYSSDNDKYELEYLVTFKNIDLFNFIKNNNDAKSFEEIISEFGIDLTEKTDKNKNRQMILDDNLNIIGMLTYIKPKANIIYREPKHCLGLENIGATCYMNATIQCLCHISNIKKYFKNRRLVYNDTNNKNCRLTKEFYKLINSLWKDSYKGKNYFTPTDFKNTISQMNPLFQGIAANDSKDLIIFLYETMHNEINNPAPYNENNNYNNDQTLQLFRNNYYSNNSSFLIKTFYFEQQSEIKCLSCGYSKTSYNISNIIIFPLEKVREYMEKKYNGFMCVKLENCFENYQEPEFLFGQNQIYCNNCNCSSNATTSNKIFASPEVLTIILNRGKGLQFDVNFEYPLSLDIDKYITDKSKGNNKYELICVLTHLGPSGMSGHFIAFCKSPVDNHWYCYNDASVSKCNDPRYQNNNEIEGIPYVLFYQKINNGIFDNNISNNYENYNINYMGYSNGFKNEGKQDNNYINLLFNYNGMEIPLSISQNHNRISPFSLVNELTSKYDYIPHNILLFIQNGDNFDNLRDYLYNNKLKDGDKITIVEND